MTNVNIYEDHKVTTNAWLIQAELYQRYVYYDGREEESGRAREKNAHMHGSLLARTLASAHERTQNSSTPNHPTHLARTTA